MYFREAIRASSSFPNPYHALGTLEHSQGNVQIPTTVLRMGLKHCPDNYRLYHAMGGAVSWCQDVGFGGEGVLEWVGVY